MNTKCFATPSGEVPIRNIAPGRKGRAEAEERADGQSVMAFEELLQPGATTPLPLHRNSDEVMYVSERTLQLQNR
jgi:hypothetical protein